MPTPLTYDQIAACYLLAGKPAPQSLLTEARQAMGEECPDCGHTVTEWNGHSPGEFRCCACDHRWGIDMGMRYGY